MVNPLQCKDPRKDTLGWAWEEQVVAELRSNGDEALLFTAKAAYLIAEYTEVCSGAVILSDQALTLTDPGGALRTRIDNPNILEMNRFADTGYLRLETDEDDVLVRIADQEERDWFIEAFQEDVLPVDVTVIDSMAEYASEKEFSDQVCADLGLTMEQVRAAAKEDELAVLERQRQERLDREREMRAAEERLQAEAKAELRRRLEEDKAAAEEQHRKGMRRLSLLRRAGETIDRALRRHLVSSRDRPVWWEGDWQDGGSQEDPYLMSEERLNKMKAALEREEQRLREEQLRKVLKVLGVLEREEAHQRKMVEGDGRLAHHELREEWDRGMEEQRRRERQLLDKVGRHVDALERDQLAARMGLEAEEADERHRCQQSLDSGASRLGGLARLLRATRHDESRMREEIARMQKRQYRELQQRDAKARQTAARGKGSRAPGSPRAAGDSRTAFFAGLSGMDKVAVLELSGQATPGQFAGRSEEALLRFFKSLPGHVQQRAVHKFKRASVRVQQEDEDDPSSMDRTFSTILLARTNSLKRRHKLAGSPGSPRSPASAANTDNTPPAGGRGGRGGWRGDDYSQTGNSTPDSYGESGSLSALDRTACSSDPPRLRLSLQRKHPPGLAPLLPCPASDTSDSDSSSVSGRSRTQLTVSAATSRAQSAAGSLPHTPRDAGRHRLSPRAAKGLLAPPQRSRKSSTASLVSARSPRKARGRSSPHQGRPLPISPASQMESTSDVEAALRALCARTPQITVQSPEHPPSHAAAESESGPPSRRSSSDGGGATAAAMPTVRRGQPFDAAHFAAFAEQRLCRFDAWRAELRQELLLGRACSAASGAAAAAAAAASTALLCCTLLEAAGGPSPHRRRVAWDPQQLLAVRPSWCDQVTYTYCPVAPRGRSASPSPNPAAAAAAAYWQRLAPGEGARSPSPPRRGASGQSDWPARGSWQVSPLRSSGAGGATRGRLPPPYGAQQQQQQQQEDGAPRCPDSDAPPPVHPACGPTQLPAVWSCPPPPRRRSPRRRNVSPLRGGGALCGGLVVRAVTARGMRWQGEY